MKHLVVLMRRGPHGSILAQEGLEVVLMASAFEQRLSVVLIDDGVHQLLGEQRTAGIGRKNYCAAFKALSMYGVDTVAVEAESLARRGIEAGDLMIEVEVLDSDALSALVHEADVVLTF